MALLASGLIVSVLDGLDEIPEEVRGAAISRINDALRPGERLVVTCRSRPYRDAVRPSAGVEVTLTGAAGIELCPLSGWCSKEITAPARPRGWDGAGRRWRSTSGRTPPPIRVACP
jgi:hypothetical protein